MDVVLVDQYESDSSDEEILQEKEKNSLLIKFLFFTDINPKFLLILNIIN
jgi:hypothetical protein